MWHLVQGKSIECARCGESIKTIKQLEEECHG